jgi:hypothetical protein
MKMLLEACCYTLLAGCIVYAPLFTWLYLTYVGMVQRYGCP